MTERQATGQPVGVADDLVKEARFLLERICDFENGDAMTEEGAREWDGHVAPSLGRLRQLLATSPEPPVQPAEGRERGLDRATVLECIAQINACDVREMAGWQVKHRLVAKLCALATPAPATDPAGEETPEQELKRLDGLLDDMKRRADAGEELGSGSPGEWIYERHEELTRKLGLGEPKPFVLDSSAAARPASQPDAGEPKNWAVVPAEPTPDMLGAINSTYCDIYSGPPRDKINAWDKHRVAYAAMLAARPAAPAPAVEPDVELLAVIAHDAHAAHPIGGSASWKAAVRATLAALKEAGQ